MKPQPTHGIRPNVRGPHYPRGHHLSLGIPDIPRDPSYAVGSHLSTRTQTVSHDLHYPTGPRLSLGASLSRMNNWLLKWNISNTFLLHVNVRYGVFIIILCINYNFREKNIKFGFLWLWGLFSVKWQTFWLQMEAHFSATYEETS